MSWTFFEIDDGRRMVSFTMDQVPCVLFSTCCPVNILFPFKRETSVIPIVRVSKDATVQV